MTAIVVTGFSGEIPRLSDKLLPQSGAALASNAKLTSGDLTAWYGPTYVTTLSGWSSNANPVKKVYRINHNGTDYWMHWIEKLDPAGDYIYEQISIFPSPVVGDTYRRFYWNEEGYLYVNSAARIAAGQSAYVLGAVAPTNTPSVTPAAATGDETLDRYVSYVYTYVSIWGEESAASEASTEQFGGPAGSGTPWTVAMGNVRTQGGTEVPYQYRRIYRTALGSDGSSLFYFVAQVGLTAGEDTYTDEIPDSQLGDAFATDGFIAAPTGVSAFTYLGNGVFATVKNKTLYLSEPYQPHAWPATYARGLAAPAVALEAINNSLIVLTEGDPIVLTGTDPSFLSDALLDINQPCVAPKSVVNVGNAVMYASPVGYVMAGLGGSTIGTRAAFSEADWKAINPSAATFACRYDDGVVLITPTFQYLIQPSESRMQVTSLNLTEVTAFYTDYETGQVYYVRNGGLYRWNHHSGTKLGYLWRSKTFVQLKPINLGVCKIESDAEDIITLTITDNAANYVATSSPVTFTFTFSESVTGFVAADVTATVDAGTVSKGALSGSGTTYTMPITLTGSGTLTVSVSQGVAAGSGSGANTSASVTQVFSIP